MCVCFQKEFLPCVCCIRETERDLLSALIEVIKPQRVIIQDPHPMNGPDRQLTYEYSRPLFYELITADNNNLSQFGLSLESKKS